MSLMRNTKLEDRIIKEYFKRMDIFNVIPLYYEKFILYFNLVSFTTLKILN